MEVLKSSIFLILITVAPIYSKMRFLLDEEIKNCGTTPWRMDLSNFELVMINETTTVANGTLVINTEVKSPWGMYFKGEQFDRGQWLKRFERKFTDFCNHVLSPTEIWYKQTNEKFKGKGCPYENGLSVTYNEEIVTYDISYMPFYFQGRWRMIIEDDFVGCYELHLDFIDD